jgi:argininosuccinate synthase
MTNSSGKRRPSRIVLAYSGDADTSMAIPWLADRHRAEVVTLTLDFGQGRDLEDVRDRAFAFGAVRAHVLDVREEFARDYLLRALKAGVLSGGDRRLVSALGHSAIAGKLVEIAEIEQAPLVAHGGVASAARIGAALRSLRPSLTVAAPALESGVDRTELLAYARARRLPLPAALAPEARPAAAGKAVSRGAPEAAAVDITFQAGTPVGVNGIGMTLLDLIDSLDFLAGKNGVGRRERFETPAVSVLAAAHGHLQRVAVTGEAESFGRTASRQYADLIEHGSWFSVERAALDAFVETTQDPVTGIVRVQLFEGVCTIVQGLPRQMPCKHGSGAHSAPASRGPHDAVCASWGGTVRSGAEGLRERPSRGVGRSPTSER